MTEVFVIVVIMMPMYFIIAPSLSLDFTCVGSPKVLHNRAGRSVENVVGKQLRVPVYARAD